MRRWTTWRVRRARPDGGAALGAVCRPRFAAGTDRSREIWFWRLVAPEPESVAAQRRRADRRPLEAHRVVRGGGASIISKFDLAPFATYYIPPLSEKLSPTHATPVLSIR